MVKLSSVQRQISFLSLMQIIYCKTFEFLRALSMPELAHDSNVYKSTLESSSTKLLYHIVCMFVFLVKIRELSSRPSRDTCQTETTH